MPLLQAATKQTVACIKLETQARMGHAICVFGVLVPMSQMVTDACVLNWAGRRH